jgi:DNA (cytosine-5)-methyltransferase 1
MYELSLFSGGGGGLLGSKLLGWRTIGYVEWEEYCQKTIRQRISDGILDDAPIYGDIETFIGDGYAERYRGVADVVTGGFPCQPFSVAGKQEGSEDPRNKWPATLRVIEIVRPRRVFLENVPGLLVSGYFGTILREMAEIGYDAKWTVLGASDVGARHIRKRLWIVANSCIARTGNKNRKAYMQRRIGSEKGRASLRQENRQACASWVIATSQDGGDVSNAP